MRSAITHAARADADQRDVREVAIALEDLVGDAGQRALDARGVHHLGHDGLPEGPRDGTAAAARTTNRVGGTAPARGYGNCGMDDLFAASRDRD